MIEGLKPYAEYKESGQPWNGAVPAHWSVHKAGQIGRLLKGSGGSKADNVDEGVPCVRYGQLYTKYRGFIYEPKSFIRPSQAVQYTAIRYGDVLFAASGEKVDEIGKSAVNLMRIDAVCGGDVIILRPRIDVCPPFLGYALDSYASAGQKATMCRGSTIKHIYPDELRLLAVSLPPPDEQAAIVRFLDHANRKIDGFIRAKRKLIGLLNEQKQAIIHRAVTRGLDPEVPLKPSGIPWLGDIPKHWGTPRLAQLSTRIGDGLHGTPEYVDQSPYHFINGNNLVNGCIRLKASTRCVGLAEFKKHAVPLGESTLLMSINGTIGSVALYRGESVILGKSAAYINCNKSLTREYLLCFLQSPAVVNFLRQEVTGTTIFNLSLASIRGLPIALPSVDEQLSIVGSIEKNTAPTSTAIARTEREIALMQEYRTRLTADLVTGKLDVCEAAAKLPDLPTDAAAEPLTDEAPDDTETEEIEA